jgi:hypothetical protein
MIILEMSVLLAWCVRVIDVNKIDRDIAVDCGRGGFHVIV